MIVTSTLARLTVEMFGLQTAKCKRVDSPTGQLQLTTCEVNRKQRKSIYIALFYQASHSAQTWITQFYLQITPCLPFLRKRSPDGATLTEVADI